MDRNTVFFFILPRNVLFLKSYKDNSVVDLSKASYIKYVKQWLHSFVALYVCDRKQKCSFKSQHKQQEMVLNLQLFKK